jgi:hypothetical protein
MWNPQCDCRGLVILWAAVRAATAAERLTDLAVPA